MYPTVYTHDDSDTSSGAYIAIPASGTPGLTDYVEPGVGFFIGAKPNSNKLGIDFPYYKR